MRKRQSATAILVALALVSVWALPAAASPAVAYDMAGYMNVGMQGECSDDGVGWASGHSGHPRYLVSSDEAYYTLSAYSFAVAPAVDGSALVQAALSLCGQLSRTPSGTVDAALGAACSPELWRASGWENGGYYYGHSGKGRIDRSDMDGRGVQIRNVTWAPSLTSRIVAWGEYVDDPLTPAGTSGRFVMQAWPSQPLTAGFDCFLLGGWPGGHYPFYGNWALIPNP